MDVAEIAPGLWRWTGRRESIGADVASVYHEGADGIVLIDPLVPPEDEARFWAVLDRDAARAGLRGVHVLTTVARHARSAGEIAARYGGRVWESAADMPNGIVALDSGLADEVVFCLADHRTLVCGDVVRGRGGRLELAGAPRRAAVDAWLALGVERVLV